MKISHLKSLLNKQFLLAALAAVFSLTTAWAQDAAEGQKLFEANCASCHALNEKLTGPALAGVHERRDEAWLIQWIKNSSKVIKSGDAYAVKLFNEYNQSAMTSFENLSDGEIKSILAYVKAGAAPVSPSTPVQGGETATVDTTTTVNAEEDGFNWKGFFIIAALVFLVIIISQLAETYVLAESMQKKSLMNLPWNNINAAMLVVFLVVGMTAAIWETVVHSKYMLGEAASVHGVDIDQMLYTTIIITAIVFFITQILLFWYGFRYRYREGQKAYFYPHNNKLEYIWTIIPAIALTVLVFGGFKTWQGITGPAPEGTPEIEVFAYQFGWSARYPGADKQLGNANFNFISGKNTLGIAIREEAEALKAEILEERTQTIATINNLEKKLDSLVLSQRRFNENSKEYKDLQKQIERITSGEERAELMLDVRRKETQVERLSRMLGEKEIADKIFTKASLDDIVVKEIHIPVNKPVMLKFRARDVIHSAYMPEFRLQMNCVPGMPTQFWFIPTKTTAEYRKQVNNPKFDYYLFCAKICGASHFNMKIKVVVESEEDYKKWLDSQKAYYVSADQETAPATTDSTKTAANNTAAAQVLALGK